MKSAEFWAMSAEHKNAEHPLRTQHSGLSTGERLWD